MAMVIFASALGVIIITEGLFLRRLLGDIAELRRQITGIDRQMRAQRAHVTALRQLLAEPDDEPPREAAVSGSPGPLPPPRPDPVRRKKHLGLHLGGSLALVAAAGAAAREALHTHRGQLASAITGAAVTSTTVTALAITPWVDTADHVGPQPPVPAVSPSRSALWFPPPPADHEASTPPISPASADPPPGGSSAGPDSTAEPDADGITLLEPTQESSTSPITVPAPGGTASGSPGLVEEEPTASPAASGPSESPPPTPSPDPGSCLIGLTPPDEEVCLLSQG
ncbi:putative membrane protein [Streptomyces scabiei 87.22]|uniref:Putative membrane protein n=1 Tax=Streptomyces scabiei (strain 87.22) TaxID=680198 RepID=C9Z8X2_STRSW|nr:putative membrane protein [Streptomyces scabiei 87.22]